MLIKFNRKNKDKKVRELYSVSELKRKYYKFMRANSLLDLDSIKYSFYQKKLANLPKVKINNYCYLTGRARGVTRSFRLSRHQIREKFKYLHGLTNSSW